MPDQYRPLYKGDVQLRPIPDPTELTSRAVEALRREFQRELTQFQAFVEAKIALTQTHIDATNTLKETKFRDIELRFTEQKDNSIRSFTAAMAAQQLANDKSERATKEQLDSLRHTLNVQGDDLRRSIENVASLSRTQMDGFKDAVMGRVGQAETRLTAAEQQKVGAKDGLKDNSMLIGVFVGIAMMILAALGYMTNHAHSSPTYIYPKQTTSGSTS